MKSYNKPRQKTIERFTKSYQKKFSKNDKNKRGRGIRWMSISIFIMGNRDLSNVFYRCFLFLAGFLLVILSFGGIIQYNKEN